MKETMLVRGPSQNLSPQNTPLPSARCLIPRFDGAILLLEWKEAVWDRFVMGAPRPRTPSEQQYSDQASLATLSRELGINPKTVAKWRKRVTVEDLKTGPKAPHSTTLSEAEEAMVVAFRRHTLLPLDDCLYALQPSIPHLSRSALHRCLQRHGISRLPDIEGDKAFLSNCVHAVRYSVLFLTIALRVTSSFRIVATMASLKGFPASRRRLVVAASCPLPERAMLSAAR